MEKPEITETHAVAQAGSTIGQYISQAMGEIDRNFGSGFARDNPSLVSGCVQAQAQDFNCVAITSALYEISEALSAIADSNS